MYFPDQRYSTYIVVPYLFPAIRAFGKELACIDVQLKISCSPSMTLAETVMEEKAQEGYRRLRFWVESVLNNIILIDIKAENFGSIASSVSNTVMFCPSPPTDHLLVSLLHSKIRAITDGFFDIHAVSILTSDTDGIETTFRNIDGYHLPDMSYFPAEAIHKSPWWTRDTIEVCEFPKGMVADQLFNNFADYLSPEDLDIEVDIDSAEPEEADIIPFKKDEDR